MRPRKYCKDKTSVFINKLHNILEDQESGDIVGWTQDQNSFIIFDLTRFCKQVLPKYFKHCNYNSFVRQLNMYNFTKIRYTIGNTQYENAYQHILFHKNNHQDLKLIKRKQTTHRCHTLMPYGHNYEEQLIQNSSSDQPDIAQKLRRIKQKQQKLQQFCIKLISQNQLLLTQNQELAHKVKKQSKKKQRILDQVFRIVGVSIRQFWDQFCQNTETLQQKTNNFKQIYQILMNFIDQNDLAKILKTLQFFIAPSEKKKKTKIFKVINAVQQSNFISSYTQQQVQQFIQTTNLILQNMETTQAKKTYCKENN